jgi:hypothetical protein
MELKRLLALGVLALVLAIGVVHMRSGGGPQAQAQASHPPAEAPRPTYESVPPPRPAELPATVSVPAPVGAHTRRPCPGHAC